MRMSVWSSDVCSSDLRIMMIHVELHLRHDAAEIGDEAAEDGRFVHPAQHRFRVAGTGQHLHEGGVGAGIAAYLRGDQAGVAAGGAHRAGMDGQAVLVRQREDFQQPDRIVLEELVVGQRQPPRSEEHTSELQSLMRQYYAVISLKKTKEQKTKN